MIITLKGCSGSGKSTIVRKVMGLYDEKLPQFIDGRKRPIGYVCRKKGVKDLFVVGHYETACGGCDTISKADYTFELIREKHTQGMNVLFEGLLLTADYNRTAALHTDDIDVRAVVMNTPLDVCLASINERRRTKWFEKCKKIGLENTEREAKRRKLLEYPDEPLPVNPLRTTEKFKQSLRIIVRLEEGGIPVSSLNRVETLAYIRKEFNL